MADNWLVKMGHRREWWLSRATKAARWGKRGFTLTELLIVVVLLGALAAVAIPGMRASLGGDDIAAANTEASNVKTAAVFCLAESGEYPATSTDLFNDGYLSGEPDAVYTFDAQTGLITEATPGEGITKGFIWMADEQGWQRD